MDSSVVLLAVFGAALIGAVAGWLAARSRTQAAVEAAAAAARAGPQVELATTSERLRAAEAEARQARDELRQAEHEASQRRDALDSVSNELARVEERASRVAGLEASLREAATRATTLSEQLIELRTRTDKERQGFQEQLQLLQDAKTALTDQFRNLANEILEEKSKRFAEQNQANLGTLLEPLKTQLSEFKGKVEEVYVQESKDRTALQEQVKHLMSLNRELSDDAKNLTLALKGSAKAQGNWGELILERVLEASGLRKGIEYIVQDTQQRDDGSRVIPDVVIQLPEDRRLVVDAKVSLVAYERHVSAS